MKTVAKLSILFFSLLVLGCTPPAQKEHKKETVFFVKYENDLFSMIFPKGWTIDDSGWKGLDSIQNVVDMHKQDGIVWFHCVKSCLPIKWKNVAEVTEIVKMTRVTSGDNIELINEIDSVEVGGYPANILYFANYVDSDTIIQKQFVTYLQDSHIVIYFNEQFYLQDWDEAQDLGDAIMRTVRFRRVKNPLEDNEKLKQDIKQFLDKIKNKS